jgi:hypothetical protein
LGIGSALFEHSNPSFWMFISADLFEADKNVTGITELFFLISSR